MIRLVPPMQDAGLAGLAGFFFLLEHRALKQRRKVARRIPMPSLEALDRVNRATLAVGFPLLSLGVVTGGLWLHARATITITSRTAGATKVSSASSPSAEALVALPMQPARRTRLVRTG